MINAFLALRAVFFALLLMFSILLLGFAGWNISSTSAIAHHASGSSIFVIFTNCLLMILIASSTIEYFKPHIRSAHVLVECGWVTVVALFQLGAAISLTTSGSSLTCQITGDWEVCASASVLVQVAWLAAFTAFAYLFALFVSVASHVRNYPDIWMQTIYTIDWFVDPRIRTFLQHAAAHPRLVSWSEYLDAAQPTAGRKQPFAIGGDVEKAPWAENISVRRGKDDPYAASIATRSYSRSRRWTPSSSAPSSHRVTASVSDRSGLFYLHSSGRGTPATENASLPPLPPKSLSKENSLSSFGSRFVERLSCDVKRSPQPTLPQIETIELFPSTVEDHDLPIPLPQKSEWVRAGSKF